MNEETQDLPSGTLTKQGTLCYELADLSRILEAMKAGQLHYAYIRAPETAEEVLAYRAESVLYHYAGMVCRLVKGDTPAERWVFVASQVKVLERRMSFDELKAYTKRLPREKREALGLHYFSGNMRMKWNASPALFLGRYIDGVPLENRTAFDTFILRLLNGETMDTLCEPRIKKPVRRHRRSSNEH